MPSSECQCTLGYRAPESPPSFPGRSLYSKRAGDCPTPAVSQSDLGPESRSPDPARLTLLCFLSFSQIALPCSPNQPTYLTVFLRDSRRQKSGISASTFSTFFCVPSRRVLVQFIIMSNKNNSKYKRKKKKIIASTFKAEGDRYLGVGCRSAWSHTYWL